jgi:glycine/D-amino acid oxidase-like deaminating enzyme
MIRRPTTDSSGNKRVTAFELEAGRVRGVVTDKDEFEASLVISATGPWSMPLPRRIASG